MDAIVKKTGLIFGLIGSTVITGIYLYIWQNQDFANAGFAVVILLLPLILAFGAQITSKFKMSGFISVKQGVLAFIACIGLIFFCEAVINYLVYTVWDPGAQDLIREAQESRRNALEDQGNNKADFIDVNYSISGYMLAAGTKFLMYTVVGIIMAIILRKSSPEQS
jgi:tellurite resistance protein TehA-like permease